MEQIRSVSWVNRYVHGLIYNNDELSNIIVTGELSNVKYHNATGYIFFTLKDERASISAVMTRNDIPTGLKFRMQDGQNVIIQGRIDVFERDGRYQLYAKKVKLCGIGDLYEKFEELKQKLNEKGYFDFEHKKPIPKYALKVGVVTAKNGAAIHDIISVSSRRNPFVQLYWYPAKVQGVGAASQIATGIQKLDKLGLDVIIVGRGGGSIEDLWAFNEEIVANAIYYANTPVISGTGHESDTTIADYVADKRAATPSAAAELAVFQYDEYMTVLNQKMFQMQRDLRQHVNRLEAQLANQNLKLTKKSPSHQLQQQQQYLAQLSIELEESMKRQFEEKRNHAIQQQQLIKQLMEQRFLQISRSLETKVLRLDGLSPTAKLVKGFGYVEKNGIAVNDIRKLKPGDEIVITMKQGTKKASVIS